ncbi:peptide-methionine (S)-S-oxide reductase MsrA [Saprospiraceae bacterium]|nr:peptide-methionine (S)-S-oxide reductase MsrA [Saprospiraceae bacterium]
MNSKMFFGLMILGLIFSSAQCSTAQSTKKVKKEKMENLDLSKYETAYFASGCFWCVEAIFESVEGVVEVVSGYSGGTEADANYPAVSAGRTDHAEAVEVYYDPEVVTFETLLVVFFGSHDASTLNRQGPDAGRQYRSAIYYKNEKEATASKDYVRKLLDEEVFSKVTTEIVPLEAFYDAEDYHQDFEARNPNQGYVRAVSVPRLKKFQRKHPELLKKSVKH